MNLPDPRLERLRQLRDEFTRFPGAAPGGTGLTGLTSNDAKGWSALQNRQTEYLNLQRELEGDAPLQARRGGDFTPSLTGLQEASQDVQGGPFGPATRVPAPADQWWMKKLPKARPNSGVQ